MAVRYIRRAGVQYRRCSWCRLAVRPVMTSWVLFFLFPDHHHRRVSRRKGSVFGQLCFLAVVGMLVLNAVATFLFTQASAANYPGGTALYTFNDQFALEDNGMS